MGDGHMNIFGFLQSILVGPSADIATNTVADAAEKIKTLITGELPPDKRVEAELKFIELQTAINMKEIQSTSLFIAGWRPAAAWAGVVCLVICEYWYSVSPSIRYRGINYDSLWVTRSWILQNNRQVKWLIS